MNPPGCICRYEHKSDPMCTWVRPQRMTDGMLLCEDCPPANYPTDKTRCGPCPRRHLTVGDSDAAQG